MRASSAHYKALGELAAKAAEDKKGEDIVLLHIHPLSTLADYMLIVSVGSPAQMEAVEQRIDESMESTGAQLSHRDGRLSELWRVLDYGGLIVHLMHPTAREFYGLERLYHGARKVTWNGR